MEAGGHIGPVSTSVLAQEILPPLSAEIPIFVAGGIGHGGADRRLSRNGRGRRAARHPLRLRARMHRPSQFQEGLHPRLGARRDHPRADRSAAAGDPGPRAQNREMEAFAAQAARGRANCSTAARSRWPRPSSRSSIIGPARSARAVIEGDVESGSVMAGQSVGMVKQEQSVADTIGQLVDEAAHALERRSVHA